MGLNNLFNFENFSLGLFTPSVKPSDLRANVVDFVSADNHRIDTFILSALYHNKRLMKNDEFINDVKPYTELIKQKQGLSNSLGFLAGLKLLNVHKDLMLEGYQPSNNALAREITNTAAGVLEEMYNTNTPLEKSAFDMLSSNGIFENMPIMNWFRKEEKPLLTNAIHKVKTWYSEQETKGRLINLEYQALLREKDQFSNNDLFYHFNSLHAYAADDHPELKPHILENIMKTLQDWGAQDFYEGHSYSNLLFNVQDICENSDLNKETKDLIVVNALHPALLKAEANFAMDHARETVQWFIQQEWLNMHVKNLLDNWLNEQQSYFDQLNDAKQQNQFSLNQGKELGTHENGLSNTDFNNWLNITL